MPPAVSRTAALSLTVSVTGRVMLGSARMQPEPLLGCTASVNTVTELGSIGPAATGALVDGGWLQAPARPAINNAIDLSGVMYHLLACGSPLGARAGG